MGLSPINGALANDLTYLALLWYIRGDAMSQTTQKKPLLKLLKSKQETFPGGNAQIALNIQGTYIDDTAGALQGYSEDDALAFNVAQNVLQPTYTWKEVQMSLMITWSELKKDGITITDHGKTSDHASAMTRITPILKNRMANFGESYARSKNRMFWLDGSQDAKQMPGLTSILTDTPTTGSTGGVSRSTYPFWQHRVNLNVPWSAQNTSLIQFLNSELIQLQRYGGEPDKALAGSAFLDALRAELVAKGYFTQTGFAGKKATNLGIAGMYIDGLGMFDYDPTLDQLGYAKRCYVIDGRRIRLMPMEGEDDKVLDPERPYNYLVFLKTMTWTGALVCDQLNANAVYAVA